MNRNHFLALLCVFALSTQAQKKVEVDGRLQPILQTFLSYCDRYGIDCHDKLFQLKRIAVTDTLPIAADNVVLGMVARNQEGSIDHILVNWIATLDDKILEVVSFHEFAHYFLDYAHTCEACDEIMAVHNPSYFAVANDWEYQVAHLFTSSPVYQSLQQDLTLGSPPEK
ncbi:MAG: hypothetical protein AAGF77_10375 [Bacteroidota bacterium]